MHDTIQALPRFCQHQRHLKEMYADSSRLPLAQAVHTPQAQVAVVVPPGSGPGQELEITTPDGQRLRVAVPAGVAPGTEFVVNYQPLATAAMPVTYAPMQHGMNDGLRYMQLQGQTPFDVLSRIGSVKIKQKIQWAQVLVGFDMPNKYLVSDEATGTDLFVAAERTGGMMGVLGRQVFEGGQRPFNLDIAMLTGPGAAPIPFIRLERPFKCTCCCFNRPVMHIYNALTNRLIGTTEEPFSFCHFRLFMRDDSNRDVLSINHHCCDCSILCWGCPCGCQEIDFEVLDNGAVVGHIRRQFNTAQAIGMVTGINADSDQFAVDFKEVQHPEWKAALIAMAIFVDYCYFTKGGQSARNESALGRVMEARSAQ